MDLSGIISISGRPGLYQVIAQGKNSIIVESLTDNKRFPAYATDRISALEDISIYTYEGDKPLKEILADIYAKEDGKQGPSHKEDISVLQSYILEIIPDYDEERVYPSDIKKLLQWYNMLLKSGNLKPADAEHQETETGNDSEKPEKEEKQKKKAAPKKKAAKASDEKGEKDEKKKPDTPKKKKESNTKK